MFESLVQHFAAHGTDAIFRRGLIGQSCPVSSRPLYGQDSAGIVESVKTSSWFKRVAATSDPGNDTLKHNVQDLSVQRYKRLGKHSIIH
jgi:hypothetical protein